MIITNTESLGALPVIWGAPGAPQPFLRPGNGLGTHSEGAPVSVAWAPCTPSELSRGPTSLQKYGRAEP
jgi:hypothetical protein